MWAVALRSLPQFAQKVENEMMTVENIYAIALVGFPIGSKKFETAKCYCWFNSIVNQVD